MVASIAVAILESSVPSGTFVPWLADDERVAVLAWDRFGDLPHWVDHLSVDHVVVASRGDVGAKTRLAATTLAGSLPGVAVATRVVPTTAVAIAASAMTAMELGETSTAALQAFDHLVSRSLSGVRLDRVTRIEFPKPSMGTYLRSMVSKGYAALTTPETVVTRSLPETADQTPLLVAAELDSAEFDACVRIAGPRYPVQSVPPIVDTRTAYGSRGAEFVALTVVSVADEPTAECPVCADRPVGTTCSFCHVRLRVPEPV